MNRKCVCEKVCQEAQLENKYNYCTTNAERNNRLSWWIYIQETTTVCVGDKEMRQQVDDIAVTIEKQIKG